MSKRTERMYKDSPKLERDGESGHVEAKKSKSEEKNPSSKTAEKDSGTEGENRGGESDMHAGHVLDRHHMYAKHEHEHAIHKGGDKKEMHERHQAEMKAMHKMHDKAGKTGGEMIEKTESDKKE